MAENMLRPTAQKRDRYWCYYLVFAASVLVPVLLLSTIYSPRHLCRISPIRLKFSTQQAPRHTRPSSIRFLAARPHPPRSHYYSNLCWSFLKTENGQVSTTSTMNSSNALLWCLMLTSTRSMHGGRQGIIKPSHNPVSC